MSRLTEYYFLLVDLILFNRILFSSCRLDFHRSKYKIAESVFDVNVDYFEQESKYSFT